MKSIRALILLSFNMFYFFNTAAQEYFTADHFAAHTYSFSLDKGVLKGEGADVILNAIDGSQFFLLGEYHDDAGISKLTAALLPLLARHGYNHFAIETGPFSAAKLEELGRKENVKDALNHFYTSHLNLTGEIPIPFFGGVEDAEFLEIALEEDYDLWGLDQEFLGGFLFLLDEAWKNSGMAEKNRIEYDVAREKLKEYYSSVGETEETQIYNRILEDQYIQSFLNEIQKSVCRCTFNAVDELRTSTEIYRDWKADLLENLEGRTDLMKEHFKTYYSYTNQRYPKVFVKMGGMHTARGMTGNVDYEIGNMLHELASFNGMTDVNIAFATRYYINDETGEIGDNLDYESEWVKNMEPILAQGDKELWKIIDLRPIRKMWVNDRIRPNAQIKSYLKKTDFIILMPPLGDSTPNYDIQLAGK